MTKLACTDLGTRKFIHWSNLGTKLLSLVPRLTLELLPYTTSKLINGGVQLEIGFRLRAVCCGKETIAASGFVN